MRRILLSTITICLYSICFAQIKIIDKKTEVPQNNPKSPQYIDSENFKGQKVLEDYRMYIGQKILFFPPNDSKTYRYLCFTAQISDTVWISKNKKNPKIDKDYKVNYAYKGKQVAERISDIYNVGTHIVHYTPSDEISGKVFEIIDTKVGNWDAHKKCARLLLKDSDGKYLWWDIYDEYHVNPRCMTLSYLDYLNSKFVEKDIYYKSNTGWNNIRGKEIILSEETSGYYSLFLQFENIDGKLDKEVIPDSESMNKEFFNKYLTIEDYHAELSKELERKKKEGYYTLVLVKVEKPSNPLIRYGKINTFKEEDDKLMKYRFEDNILKIIWAYPKSGQGFLFNLENISEHTIKIIWDETSFVDNNGNTNKIIHNGIKYIDAGKTQPATSIVSKSSINDILIPVNNIRYSNYFKDWITDVIFETSNRKMEGQTFKILLPIQYKDVVNDYIFSFKILWSFEYPELQSE